MKRLFNIESPESDESKDQLLLCEISYYHICLASADAATKQLIRLAYFENNQPISAQDVKHLLDKEGIHLNRYQKVVISSAFPDAMLVPQSVFDLDDLKTQLQQADHKNIFYDRLEQQGALIAYSLPERLYQELSNRAQLEVINVHTSTLRNNQYLVAENQVSVHFSSREFRVLVTKEQKLQLAQVYPYTAPLDVVYYLLMISNQFQLSQTETAVVLSGLIDEGSALYKEIYQYFSNVQFAKVGFDSLPENEHQPHFFSSIYNLAACVS